MVARNTTERWGTVAKSFHWVIALIIIGSSILALVLVNADETLPENVKRYIALIKVHKSFGLTVLVLVAMRAAWAMANTRPVVPHGPNPWEARLMHLAHLALYGLMLLVPLSGWLSSSSFGSKTRYFNLFLVPNIWPKDPVMIKLWHPMHKFGSWILLAFVVGHIGAALWHHFVRKDDVLRNMLPFGRMKAS